LPEKCRPQGLSLEIEIGKCRHCSNYCKQPEPEHTRKHVGNYIDRVGDKKNNRLVSQDVDGAHEDLKVICLGNRITELSSNLTMAILALL